VIYYRLRLVNILAEYYVKFKTIPGLISKISLSTPFTIPTPGPISQGGGNGKSLNFRFRSAKEAEINEKKAKDRGEVLPTEERFDSNCITPGTPFMTRQIIHL
jgi:5'-3' exoribonuclease 1